MRICECNVFTVSVLPSVHRGGGRGEGVGCLGKCTMSTFLLQKCSCLGGGGGGSRKMHYSGNDHILATKVLMPVGGGVGCPGKCTIQLMSQQMSTFLIQKCSCSGVSGKMYYSGNVSGNEHILATKVGHAISLPVISLLTCCQKEVLKSSCKAFWDTTLGMSTFWLTSARYVFLYVTVSACNF